MTKVLPRRTILRGALGTALALPFLDAMQGANAASGSVPKRVIFCKIPVGFAHLDRYTPIDKKAASGAAYTLTDVLSPLEPLQKKLTIISGLQNTDCEGGNGDAHERGTASMLTCEPASLNGALVTNGISIDQFLAQRLRGTPLPSLELGVDDPAVSGKGVLVNNISFRDKHSVAPKEIDPARLWDRLFSDLSLPKDELARRRHLRESVLSDVRESARQLSLSLGPSDRIKLDQYLTGIGELETRLNDERACLIPLPKSPSGSYNNEGLLETHDKSGVTAHHKIMMKLLAQSFACDLTRIATFVFAAGTFADFRFLGFQEEHHQLSHFPLEASAKLDQICQWEMELFAYLLAELDSIEESDGSTVLDNTLVFLSSDVSDGELHNYDNLPVLLAGGGGKVLKTGSHIVAKDRPLADLFLSMMQFMGVTDVKTFGKSGREVLSGLMR